MEKVSTRELFEKRLSNKILAVAVGLASIRG